MSALRIRGLHLDPARRHLKVDTVLRIVDRAAQCHINVLHLHLTDDQGIAFESEALNYHHPEAWSIKEQEQIYERCRRHNIEIIPEIDIPGHTVALRSILHDGIYEPEKRMGIISSGLINLDDMSRILTLYDEVANRFRVKYFHMGGDETRGASRDFFQKIVDQVCEWGKINDIQIVAWEDVLAKVNPPNNIIIQKWKHRTFPPIAQRLEKIGNGRVIFSNNYYIDTCIDPFTAYRTKIPPGALGCIACTWGELIGDENVESSIFPTLYLLGHRWENTSDDYDPPIPILLDKCKTIGWITQGDQETWKRRQWRGFILKEKAEVPPRSSSSVTKDTRLVREEDNYPIISNFLIRMSRDFDDIMNGTRFPPESRIETYVDAMIEAGGKPEIVRQLLKINQKKITAETFKSLLRKIRTVIEAEEQDLYKNGIRMVIRESLRFQPRAIETVRRPPVEKIETTHSQMITTVISLSGKKNEYGESLQLPAAKNIVYVGRVFSMGGWRLKASPFHNPFKASEGENVIEKYRQYILEKLRKEPELIEKLKSYRGKALACWCSPGPCHADVLREIIEGYFPGDVVCGQKPGRGQGAYPIVRSKNGSEYANIPAYSRGAGIWKTLSPFFLAPETFEEIMPDGSKVKRTVTCIENLWQATKVENRLSGESSGQPPKKEWWSRRDRVWKDEKAHRHVLDKIDRVHPSEGRHYWNGKYLSYAEARKEIYIPFYWKAAEKEEAFKMLVNMRERGVNFQIIGPDGRKINSALGLYGELQNLTKPFGHELVLVAMILNQRIHEWKVKNGVLMDDAGKRAMIIKWPKP